MKKPKENTTICKTVEKALLYKNVIHEILCNC